MAQPPTPEPPDDAGFSDSDQAWWDRARGLGRAGPPQSAAEREGEALHRVLAFERQRGLADRRGGGDNDRNDRNTGDGVQSDLEFDAELTPEIKAELDAELPATDRNARWQRSREKLRQEGLINTPQPWRRAGWGAALAAGLLVAFVMVQRPGDDLGAYGEPPEMRSLAVELRRLPVAAPRAEAEALLQALRAAGWKAALYRRGRDYVLDTAVDADMPAAARAALQTRGVLTPAGVVRLEFVPR